MIPQAFVKYLYHFHVDRDYFECHEILEEYWKEETAQQKDSIWVGFILLAVANYHHRRNNFSGAIKTLEKAQIIIKNRRDELGKLGLEDHQLLNIIQKHFFMLIAKEPYQSYSLPISDITLLNSCFSLKETAKDDWGNRSDLNDLNLVDRHKNRDRTQIIAERLIAIHQRKKKKDSD